MQKKYENRMLFLKQFTKHLILESKPKHEEIEVSSDGKQKYKVVVPIMLPQLPDMENMEKPVFRRPAMPNFSNIQNIPDIQKAPQTLQAQQVRQAQQIPQVRDETLGLAQLTPFVRNPEITEIECPGPGKLVLVVSRGKTMLTKIRLSKEEIQKVINKFSETAKVPVISGLFKAAVNNLLITGVVSDIAGSRFVITKIRPGFIFEQLRETIGPS